jgi:hypothetical protein
LKLYLKTSPSENFSSDGFTGEFYENFKEEIMPNLHKFVPKIEEKGKGYFPIHLMSRALP